LAYSVAHYAFEEGELEEFVIRALELLAPGGRFLLGDIPNESKRRRFLASAAGREFQHLFARSVRDFESSGERGSLARLDDNVIESLASEARSRGYEAHRLQQPPELPMANRREDLLLAKP
jgi:hypothetical protein